MKQKLKSFWLNSNLWTAILCVAALLLIVVPMLYISQYVWPSSDDYEFSIFAKEVFVSGGSIFEIVKQAWGVVVEKYLHWQGTYSAIFLMAMQPGIWGDQFYGIGAVIVIVSLLAGLFSLSYVLMVKHGKAKKSVWLSITSLVTFAWLLRLMYTEEAFYWWNGASYYMGFFSWAMILMAAELCFYTDWQNYGKVKKSFFYIISALACLFLGGGSYPAALLFVLTSAGVFVSSIINKKKSVIITGSITAFSLVGLLINVLAPGNVNHMNNGGIEVGAVEAIFISIRDGLLYIRSWTNISVIMLFVFLVPFIWQLVKNCPLKFKYPVLATILSGGLYLSEYAPISYAFGGFAPGRMINIYYLNFYLLLLFNVCYWIGWICRRLETKKPELFDKIEKLQQKWQSVFVCTVGVLFLLSIVRVGITNTNLYKVYVELYNGSYEMVDQFYEDRLAYMEGHQGEDVVVDRVPYESAITYFSDLFADKEHRVNIAMARYYGLKSISLRE